MSPLLPRTFVDSIIDPALRALPLLLPDTPNARRILLAIAIQETNLASRYQVLDGGSAGPARGWWQFERIGVEGVMQARPSTTRALCDACFVLYTPAAVWRALEGHDKLAVGFARMLLLTHAAALPTKEQDGWNQYIELWRPGKPSRTRWNRSWAAAVVEFPL